MSGSIVLCGSFGGANVGDEVIFHADVELARRAGFQEPIGVLTFVDPAGAPAEQTAEIYGADTFQAVYFKKFFAALRLAWGKSLFIGGGQVLDGAYGAQLAILQLAFAISARAGGGRVCIGGAGAYKIEGRPTRFFYDLLFRLCADISLRDEASLREVSYSAAVRRKGRVAADVVFSLREALEAHATGDRPNVGLAVHCAPHTRFMQEEDAARMAADLWRAYGDRAAILVHDNRAEFDLDFAHRVAQKAEEAHGAGPVAVRVLADVETCLDYYAKAELAVSARMHPLIIGALAGARCVPLSGSRKVSEFAGLLGFEVTAQDDPEVFARALQEARLADPDRLKALETEALSVMESFR